MRAPIIVYKETEDVIIKSINEALQEGLPLFCIEAIMKNIYTEIQQQTAQQYQAACAQMQLNEETTSEQE